MSIKLDIASLRQSYSEGLSPRELVSFVYTQIEANRQNPMWISLVSKEKALARADELESLDRTKLPLYGIPFAVKDNMDVEFMHTTAGCPEFSYLPEKSAAVVSKLLEAGSILIGKTNMDQFATGLVGVRSPYGACSSVFDERYISGGSSSGSAVAVASGTVSFALGTDTAGSGRVPAALNNIVGLKPTRGAISTVGVVAACRSLDCISVFALTAKDAGTVLKSAQGFDSNDPYSRDASQYDMAAPWVGSQARIGVLRPNQREFFGNTESAMLYERAITTIEGLGNTTVEFDYEPFKKTAALLYQGPWVAERYAAIRPFFDSASGVIHSVVKEIIAGGLLYSATDAFDAQYELNRLKLLVKQIFDKIDVLLLPTAATTYSIEDVLANPIVLNSNMGYYTNFVNLLDLAAVAVPSGFWHNGLPFGVTFVGQAHTDQALLILADRFHRSTGLTFTGVSTNLDDTEPVPPLSSPPGCTHLAVVGAHLTGQPLNHQLTSRAARLVLTTQSAPTYRLYYLPNTVPAKPGLVRDPEYEGAGVELEVWAMPTYNLGGFVAEIPAPLGIGTIELSDGRWVNGFICEPAALTGATEITHYGGWRNYLNSR
jgi:allophanate hydrolase